MDISWAVRTGPSEASNLAGAAALATRTAAPEAFVAAAGFADWSTGRSASGGGRGTHGLGAGFGTFTTATLKACLTLARGKADDQRRSQEHGNHHYSLHVTLLKKGF